MLRKREMLSNNRFESKINRYQRNFIMPNSKELI